MREDILYPLRCLHGKMHEASINRKIKKSYKRRFRELRRKNPKTVFLILTPEHGNTGDHAIAYAESALLGELGIDSIEVTGAQLNEWKRRGILGLMNGAPILFHGGGNLGTLWFDVEQLTREIIRCNPKSPIYALPNTFFYEDSPWGREEMEKSREIYNAHRHLRIYARERPSYEAMVGIYQDVKLVPDMVLSLPRQGAARERKGCLLCLRGDHEKTRTAEQELLLRQQVEDLFGEAVTDTDMVISGRVPVEQRNAVLESKFNEFAGAELVITDRLHGMIFCAVTGTPCIVINSRSPKVRGCYEWIKELDYIHYVEDVSQIVQEYQKMNRTDCKYDNTHLAAYYNELKRDILGMF